MSAPSPAEIERAQAQLRAHIAQSRSLIEKIGALLSKAGKDPGAPLGRS